MYSDFAEERGLHVEIAAHLDWHFADYWLAEEAILEVRNDQ